MSLNIAINFLYTVQKFSSFHYLLKDGVVEGPVFIYEVKHSQRHLLAATEND